MGTEKLDQEKLNVKKSDKKWRERMDILSEKADDLEKKTAKKTENTSQSGMKYVTLISVELLTGIAVGSFLGFYIDKFFETKPLFFIICMILGLAGGFANLIKSLNK